MRVSSFIGTVVAMALLVGCGGDSEPVSEPTPAASEAAINTPSEPEPTAESEETQPAAFSSVETIGMTLSWRVVDTSLEVAVTGPTTGWVAVGFKPSRGMRDANILIGYVSGDETVMSDQYGVSMTGHRPDDQIGGDTHLAVLSGEEADGETTITFRIPLDSGDEYDQPLAAGETVQVILAYGPNGQDDMTTYHAGRAGIEITI